MRALKLNLISNDLVRMNGRFQFVTADDAIIQRVSETLRIVYGEWFLDTTKGIPYYQNILVKNPNLDVIQALLQNAILAVNGIVELKSFNMVYTNSSRTLNVTWYARSTNGTVIGGSSSLGTQQAA